MKPSIYPIVSDYPGQLFIMPKPSGEWLQEDLEYYRFMGADTIISMLEAEEISELSLQKEDVVCADNKLDFINFPIMDRGLPDRDSFKVLVRTVTKRLRKNEGVAIHCRAGIGRSGMLVCCALAELIGSAENAIEFVTQARGVEVPDTQEQREFIFSIVKDL
ncbi:MAG: dual specificity protein phosphatase family protein [Litoreibacter sp.]